MQGDAAKHTSYENCNFQEISTYFIMIFSGLFTSFLQNLFYEVYSVSTEWKRRCRSITFSHHKAANCRNIWITSTNDANLLRTLLSVNSHHFDAVNYPILLDCCLYINLSKNITRYVEIQLTTYRAPALVQLGCENYSVLGSLNFVYRQFCTMHKAANPTNSM